MLLIAHRVDVVLGGSGGGLGWGLGGGERDLVHPRSRLRHWWNVYKILLVGRDGEHASDAQRKRQRTDM